MKFSCVKENLERALSIAERFTGKNITLPILGNLLMEMQGSSLQITATNLEYALQITIPGKGPDEVRLSVPAKVVASLVQSIREEKVDLEEKQGNLLLRTETRDTRINGISAEEFPLFPKIKKTHSFRVESGTLKSGLGKVLPVAAISEFKPELCGVLFKIAEKTLRLAATDTFRLAEKEIVLNFKPDGNNFSFILPQRVGQELVRVLEGRDEEVTISLGENQVLFEAERVRVVSRLIEGAFPEYQAIIPRSFETTVFLKKSEFLDAVRAASIFASKLQDVLLKFKTTEVEILAANPEVGEYKTALGAAMTGKEVTTSFNYRYLLDALSGIDEEEFFMGLNSAETPSLLRNKTEATFLYVLMPIRLK